MPMTSRACPVCGRGDASRLFAESTVDPAKLDAFAFASRKMPEYMHHRLLECTACDTLYASPVPARAELEAAYEAAAFDSGVEAGYASRTYGRLLASVCPALPDRAAALDIGTGDGAFLGELLAAGFGRVAGVEPSSAPIEAADPAVRSLIVRGLFDPADHEPASYSLITCFQTMEHVDDPVHLCRGAFGLLKPGGALFLIGHDRRALSAKLLGRRSPIFDVEHLQLFSPRSARVLMERTGYERVRVEAFVNRYPLRYWAKLLPLPAAAKRSTLGLLNVSGVGRLPIALPVGNMAIVGFRPGAAQ
ncbi:MAG TPA: class I SAM-dependent methyltransferase [Gemmatirosa sp.]